MRNTSRTLPMAVIAAAVALVPAFAHAQGPQPMEQVAQTAARNVNLPPALAAAIVSGNASAISQVIKTLGMNPAANPNLVQAVAAFAWQTASSGGGALKEQILTVTIAALSAQSAQVNVSVLQTFSSTVAAAALSSGANSIANVQAATAAMVAGAGKDEATVGLVARSVSSGVVKAMVDAKIQATVIAEAVQTGVATGAAKVVGPNVTVRVDTTDDKPVSDVTLVRTDTGRELAKGQDVQFVSVQATQSQVVQAEAVEQVQEVLSPTPAATALISTNNVLPPTENRQVDASPS